MVALNPLTPRLVSEACMLFIILLHLSALLGIGDLNEQSNRIITIIRACEELVYKDEFYPTV